MLIAKRNLAVLEACAKQKEGAYALTSVKIDQGKMWSSNGHCLWGSALPEIADCEYPDLGFNQTTVDYDGCILIEADSLRKAAGNIPSKCLPILEHLQIRIDGEYKHLIASDLKTTNDVKIRHGDSTEWPDQDQITASMQGYEYKAVHLSVIELEIMVKVLKKHGLKGDDAVKIEVAESDQPVRVTVDGLVGVIMPMMV